MGKNKNYNWRTKIEKIEAEGNKKNSFKKTPKRKVIHSILHWSTPSILKVLFSDKIGNTLFWSSAGAVSGFPWSKKGYTFLRDFKVGDIAYRWRKAAVLELKTQMSRRFSESDLDVNQLFAHLWLTVLRSLGIKTRPPVLQTDQKRRSQEGYN